MLIKKLLCALLAAILLFAFTACGSQDDPTIDVSDPAPSSEDTSSVDEEKEEVVVKELNPLTGELTLEKDAVGKKPVAFTINNVKVAQKVQSGISKADVVFETEVEGGITRLLAVFSDPTAVEKIGTIRSLRVPFAEIACGIDAILFYHGIDYTYCKPYLATLKFPYTQVDSKTYGYREKNGLASEHTLFTSGNRVDKAIADKKLKDEGDTETWLNFSSSDEKVAAGETVANKVTVKFSNTETTHFAYDAETGKYARQNKKGEDFIDDHYDCKELFSNVFVLKTSITFYPDGKHRKVALSGGSGYYISAGGATEITWSKGDAYDDFKFTAADGTELKANKGNSYVCLVNSDRTPIFE